MEFLLALQSNHIFYRFETKRDIGRKSRFFHTPPATLKSTDYDVATTFILNNNNNNNLMPPLWTSLSKYCYNIWSGKTRMAGVPHGKKFQNIFTSFNT